MLQAIILPLLLLQVTAPPAPAGLDTVAIGARVRVRFPGKQTGHVAGVLSSVTDAGVVLTTSWGERSMDWGEVGVVERPAGKRSAWKAGMGLGMVVGGVIGAVVGSASYEPCPKESLFCFDLNQGYSSGGGALVGMVAGGLVGAALGVAIGRTRWEPVVLPGGDLGARVTLR